MNISEGKCMAARIDMIKGVNHAFKRRNYHENGENIDSHKSENIWDTPGIKYTYIYVFLIEFILYLCRSSWSVLAWR
jgi:hypothetical protein